MRKCLILDTKRPEFSHIQVTARIYVAEQFVHSHNIFLKHCVLKQTKVAQDDEDDIACHTVHF